MACLDLSRIDNSGKVDPLIALTEGCAELV
jgi:hypothetical protein